MIKPPSTQHEYSFIWSRDPALLQVEPLAADATDVQREQHAESVADRARKLEVARETGDYSALIVPGKQPVCYQLGHLNRTDKGWFDGEVAMSSELGRPLGIIERNDLIVRIALRSIDNFKHKVKRAKNRAGVWLAEPDICNHIDEAQPTALAEMADAIYQRVVAPLRPLH